MAKKKKTTKKKQVPIKRIALKKKPEAARPDAIDLDSSNETLCFNIKDEDGKQLGVIEDTAMAFHRHVMIASGMVKNDREDYLDYLAEVLSVEYKVPVTKTVAYKMALYIIDMFADEKKKYDWIVDLVAEFGIGALSEEMKTPDILLIIFSQKDKIAATQEYKSRKQQSVMTAERVKEMIHLMTGDLHLAESSEAHFALQELRRNKS